MKLTDRQIKTASTKPKRYKLTDGKGLFLLIEPSGSKKWRYKYSYLGKEKLLGLGIYPDKSLADARLERQELRKQLDQNIDPSTKRKEKKRLAQYNADNSFEAVAKEWHDNNINKWTPQHAHKLWRRLELHIFPALGNRPVSEITTIELLDTLRKIEKDDKTETSHRALQTCKVVFQFAVLTQKVTYNPANDLQGVLKAHKAQSYPTIGHNQIPEFLEKLETVKTSDLTRLAIKALILTFVRQGELRRAKWTDINFETKEWRVRAETTKMRTLHHVPLSQQTIEILQQVKKITGDAEYVFASQYKRKYPYMSENTINKVIHEMGYKGALVGHGFRSMASTILNENGFKPDVIERQLAHMPRDKVRAAYNRAEYLPERRKMMDWWGNFIKGVSNG